MLTTYIIVFFGGMGAGFIDSIAGGGGMITIPILLSAGLPPHLALGTNKLQAPFGTLTAAIKYKRSGLIKMREIWPGIIFTFIGAMSGTIIIQRISADLLEKAVPVLLGIIFIYTLFSKDLGSREKHSRMRQIPFLIIFGLIIGLYDGIFGPGTGSFWTVAFVTMLGMNIKGATAAAKPMNLASNVTALIFFIIGGNVLFIVGLVMAGGQIIGSYFGSHLVIKSHPKFIRYALLLVVAVTILNTFRKFYL